MLLPKIEDTDVVRLAISINGSFQNNVELSGRELKRLVTLISDQAPSKDPSQEPKRQEVEKTQEGQKPQGTSVGDNDIEKRN